MSREAAGSSGHAFISYVREDAARVDRLQRILEGAGIQVWRDTKDLWGGEDWRIHIRNAITEGALAFIACFSTHSDSREASYQNEELLLAVEQLRLRPPDRAWLIPVRFDDVSVPGLEIGGGRLLNHLQRIDLLDDRWEVGAGRLVASVLRILERFGNVMPASAVPEEAVAGQMKRLLLDSSKQIELEELVMGLCNQVHDQLTNEELFPAFSDELTNDIAGHKYLAAQADKYWEVVSPVVDALIVGCAWGLAEHNSLWTRAIARVVNSGFPARTQEALVNLRRLPLLMLIYGGGIAAVNRGRYDALRAITTDGQYRSRHGERLPFVAAAHPWRVFERGVVAANILALEAQGQVVDDEVVNDLVTRNRRRRLTPTSDLLHDRLRPNLQDLIPDDADYTTAFDRLEVLLALVAADLALQHKPGDPYPDGPWYGSYTWRDQYLREGIEAKVASECTTEQSRWPPIEAGLFGGSPDRADAACQVVLEGAAEARRNRF
jgi:hypothetical protein